MPTGTTRSPLVRCASAGGLLTDLAQFRFVPGAAARYVRSGHRSAAADPRLEAVTIAWRTFIHAVPREDEVGWVRAIERRRAALAADRTTRNTRLPGQRARHQPLGDITARVATGQRWGLALLRLTRALAPVHVVELGTSVGISGSYLAAGLQAGGGVGRLSTLEGVPEIAAEARCTFEAVGLTHRVEVIEGRFNDTLGAVLTQRSPVGLVYLDGDHDEHATLHYIEALLPSLTSESLVVLDDIRWSAGMARAWRQLRAHEAAGVVVDLGKVGVWGPRP